MLSRRSTAMTVAFFWVACSGPAVEPPPGQPADELAREFDAVCRAMRDGDNPYYGTARLREHERWIAQPVDDELAQALARGRLGAELLREGRSAEAARRFDEALVIARDARLETPIVLDLLRRAALAHLRRGEQENCIAGHAPASCILPLMPAGVHKARARRSSVMRHIFSSIPPIRSRRGWRISRR
ncbi:MAG: hypothetical protein GTO30_14075 [Acidobacteria bacterium]|nr:hypothetical protein [Acidobacteriota bacterium]NIQ84874.1 hypothetical protein [Acidobacteriota bacterium]